ncbi:MAG: radical SAM protein [Magnetococcus sp. WYHC-3]
MSDKKSDLNRFGEKAVTMMPEDAPLADRPGHKLRTSNVIVDRKALAEQQEQNPSTRAQTLIPIRFEDQEGFVRADATAAPEKVPNQFSGPSFRTRRERFRLDGHKMMYHLDRIAQWQRGERFAPIHIDMGLTKFCNTACLYCYAVIQNMTKGQMIQRDALLAYIRDCGRLGVKSIGFIGDGEPTLNPAVYDAAVLAREVGVETSMATNGLLLDMDRAEDLLRSMTWIRFNLSAGTPEGFRRVHQSKAENFPLLVEKIRALVAIRQRIGSRCTLGLQMVLIPECFDEVMAEARLALDLGVDYFVIKQCSDSEYRELGIDYSEYQRVLGTLKEAEALSTPQTLIKAKWDKIQVVGAETPLYKDGYRKYDQCYGTPFLVQISGNGDVYPCGPFFNKKRFHIGNLHDGNFHDLVMSERYWAVHRDVSEAVDVHKDCAIGCRQDYINKFLWDLRNPPEHVNFV